MPTDRHRGIYQRRIGLGLPSGVLGRVQRHTLRNLSVAGQGRRITRTTRQSVHDGMARLIHARGRDINNPALMAIVVAHLRAEQATRRSARFQTTYAAASWDAQDRPLNFLVLPNQVFGSHSRGETESQQRHAQRGDHRGHGVAQASTLFPPGLHHDLMTSQSPEMNTAVQLPLERATNQILQANRIPIFEVSNEFGADTPDDELPRAVRQRFVLLSTNSQGTDVRLHFDGEVSQR